MSPDRAPRPYRAPTAPRRGRAYRAPRPDPKEGRGGHGPAGTATVPRSFEENL